MPKKQPKNGHALERAVRLIQQAVLKSDPNLKGSQFTIEANKIVTVQGVRHELDVFVKTLPDSPYESTCIFECKDWKKPVGKNEVIILNRKVDLVGANRGFLVARSITKDAEAQLKLDRRLRFLQCTDNFLSSFAKIEVFHVQHDPLPIRIHIKERGVPATPNPEPLEWNNITCTVRGDPIEFVSLVKTSVERCVALDKKDHVAEYRENGAHYRHCGEQITFEPRECFIGNIEVEYLTVDFYCWVNVRRPKLLSKFELKDQGQIYSFEPFESTALGREVQIDLVLRT